VPDFLERATVHAIEERLGHRFADPRLLTEALTHPSHTNENTAAGESNQRLEFLGDAVVGMVITQYLYESLPEWPEGELTKVRAAVVCEPTLARRSQELGIGAWLRLGRGEAASGGRERHSILADAFEALAGAIYLDAGLEGARRFVLRQLQPEVETARAGQLRADYKTQLQEYLQRRSPEYPSYKLLSEEGPDHQKRFLVAVLYRDHVLGRGWGRTKKEAEQEAAREALASLPTRLEG
jgi:ribonuclease III